MKIFGYFVLLITSFHTFGQVKLQSPSNIDYDSLRIILEKMNYEDQNIRRILVDSIGLDSPKAGPYFNQMSEIDSKNQKTLISILDNYGWIEQSKIGKNAADAFFHIIQHSDISIMFKWFPIFKKLAKNGEANKVNCAMMEDRLLMWQGKKQIYGSQANVFREDKQLAIWPIIDSKNVNKRRKEIGFELTVEKNAERLKAIYDSKEKLPLKTQN